MNNIKEHLAVILSRTLAKKSTPDLKIYEKLSSLELVELIIRIEKDFEIEISPLDYDVKMFETLDTITHYIETKRNVVG